MNLNKTFFFLILILFSVNYIYSVGTVPDNDNTVSYYEFENDVIDSVGNYNGTDTGTVNASGKIDWGRDFNSSDNIDIGDVSELEGTAQFSVSGWYNFSSVAAVGLFSYGTVTNQHLGIFTSGSDFFVILNNGANTYGTGVSAVGLNDSTFHHIVMVYNGSSPTDAGKLKLYIDNVSQTMTFPGGSIPATTYSAMNVFQIGRFQQQASSFNGAIDEFAILNYSIQADEVNFLYQNDNPNNNQQWQFSVTPQIQTNLSSVYNQKNISINLTTITNVNMSYILDGGGLISIANDTNNTILNLFNLSEITHNISFRSEDINGINWNNQTFLVDTQPANVSVNNFTEWNDGYNVTSLNTTLNITCEDANLDHCEIHWDDNTTTNISSTQYKLFNTNGNHTFTLEAHDLANNTVDVNGTIFINPNNYFEFQLPNGTQITNYTLNGTLWNDTANYTTYELGLGNHTLIFEKLGFATTNITFTLNTTNELNTTYNITSSKIIVNIFDRETSALLTGLSTLTLVATVGFNTTTTTGQVNISDINFIEEEYQLIVEHSGYATETVYFTYNNQETLTVNIYMLNLTTDDYGFINTQAIANTGQLIEGALCKALEWVPSQSAFISIAESNTNVNGIAILNIEIGTKLYKFSCSKDDITTFTDSQIIQSSGTTIPIVLQVSELQPSNILGGFNYNFTNSTLNASYERVRFAWADSNNLVSEGCVKVYSLSGIHKTLISSSCSSGSTNIILKDVFINNTFTVVAVASVTYEGQDYIIDSVKFLGTSSLYDAIKNYHFDIILPLMFLFLGIAIGFLLDPQNIYMSLFGGIIGIWLGLAAIPTIVSLNLAIFISFILGLTIWGAYKFK